MQIGDIFKKQEFCNIVINELKEIGVKYRKEKKCKNVQETNCRKRIFRTNLHLLELTDVILANGRCVEIPRFVADACNRILEQVETEGIFRKAGSSIRQKEIRISLEAGLPLGKSHHVIDVANVLKYFIRELPESLIPPSIQETLLRSLLIGNNHVKAILLTCLLLPPLTINTLSFFMQFLYTVALSENFNKMSIENLAIIFTPGLMPCANINSHRFASHLRAVQLLIENANSIGTIPDNIVDKLKISENASSSHTPAKSLDAIVEVVTQKKKKKRRSEMFSGIRKIVGNAIGNSAENLENTPENKVFMSSNALATDQQQQLQQLAQPANSATTPCLKSTKKRKFAEPVCAFSAKKKRDLLALLPNNSGGFLPNTPLTKETKKSRLSLGYSRHAMKNISINPVVTSMERRWSIVGSGWSKQKNKNILSKNAFQSNENIFETTPATETNPSLLSTTNEVTDSEVPIAENMTAQADSEVVFKTDPKASITKNEFEEIKERVAAIETCISQEFNSLAQQQHAYSSAERINTNLSGPERVENKYKKMMVETEALLSPATEQLAQRLSRDLKIRRSVEQRIIRSPSARKIGHIRRRSQEKIRISRNPTWHIGSTSSNARNAQLCQSELPSTLQSSPLYNKAIQLKRGRPNTLHTGLYHQQLTPVLIETDSPQEKCITNEKWTSGELFFNSKSHNQHIIESKTPQLINTPHINDDSTPVQTGPCYKTCIEVNIKTPMLPPKSVPRKLLTSKTPNSAMKLSSATKLHMASNPTNDDIHGRESIARLRTQNAGMVMAKAKLFDGLVECGNTDHDSHMTTPKKSINVNRRISSRFTPATKHCPSQPFNATHAARNADSNKNHSNVLKNSEMERMPLNRKKVTTQSPIPLNKRQRLPANVKNPCKQLLETVITDDQLVTQPRKITNDRPLVRKMKTIKDAASVKNTVSPKTVIKIRNHMHLNSPRRARNPLNIGNVSHQVRSPMKATAYRNSPRFTKAKKKCAV